MLKTVYMDQISGFAVSSMAAYGTNGAVGVLV